MINSSLYKNPIFIMAMIYGSASMGLFTSFTFYYFQHFLLNKIFYFLLMYLGILIANLIGFIVGFNIAKRYARIIIYFSCFVQVISFPLIYIFYLTNIVLTIIIVTVTGFFDAMIGLYLIPKANRVQRYDSRLQQNTLLWGFLYLGMAIFAILFIINIAYSFLFGMVTTIIGTNGLFLIIQEDKSKFEDFKRISLREVFRLDYLSYLLLFSLYFMFFFSMVSIIVFSLRDFNNFGNNSLMIFLIPLFVVNSLFPLTFWYLYNKRFSLKSVFNLTYLVSSISLILLYFNPNFLLYAYILELWTWSVYQIHIFVNIGDSFPGLRNIQPINFWWLMLALSVGLGIIFPLIFINRSLLLSIMLILILGSIPLSSFLKSINQPCNVHAILIQGKNGEIFLERVFSNFELNTEFLSGVFNATKVLFKESFKSSTDYLRSFEYENKTLILSESELFYCIAVTDRYDDNLRKALIEISNLFEVSFYQKITTSNLNMPPFKVSISELPSILRQKVNSLDLS